MRAGIVSVGTELVTGQCVDTNSAWLSSRLTERGIAVVEHVTVGDDVSGLDAAVRRIMVTGELLIVTGGLGPTADDITRDGLARALEAPLIESAEAMGQIRAFFERWQRPMPESNRLQALIPRGCEVLPNTRGTAPGILFRRERVLIAALPGVPTEMKAMFEATVAPMLPKEGGACTRSVRLHCFGISEAKLGETIHDLMRRDRNPLVGTTASQAVLAVRILATAESEARANELLTADEAEVRRRLGTVVYGNEEDTLQSVVVAMLTRSGRTVSTAESCTGGGLAERITEVPGSSVVFPRGFITYSNEAKAEMLGVSAELIAEHGAVSEPVARAMALGCRARAKTDFALAITGIAGPSGGSPPERPVGLAYIALADASECAVQRILFGEHLVRQEIRDRACKTALNMLRLRLVVPNP